MEYGVIILGIVAINILSFTLGYRQGTEVSNRYFKRMEKAMKEANK